MKFLKYWFFTIAFGTCAAAQAQSRFPKNPTAELSLGGSIKIGEDIDDRGSFGTTKSLSISGSYLWFLVDRFELGPEWTYSGQWQKSSNYRYHFWSIGVGPRLKYNFADIYNSTVVPYAAGGLQVSTGNSDLTTPNSKDTGDQTYVGAGLTFPFQAVAAIYVEAQYIWSHTKSKYDPPSGSTDDGVDVRTSRDLLTFVGVNLYL